MDRGRKWAALLTVIMLMAMLVIPVYGHDAPDLQRTGSISLVMKDDRDHVPGGKLVLYRVGDLAQQDGNYSFVLTEQLEESCISLADIQSGETAAALAAWIQGKSLQGVEVTIDENGQAKFQDLKVGLYLIVQEEAPEGYLPVAPFLVSLPMFNGTKYLYEVEASPKVGKLEEAPTEVPPTTKPPSPPGQLPQTGQNNWPVPVLACVGVAMVMLGVVLCRGQKRDKGQN